MNCVCGKNKPETKALFSPLAKCIMRELQLHERGSDSYIIMFLRHLLFRHKIFVLELGMVR